MRRTIPEAQKAARILTRRASYHDHPILSVHKDSTVVSMQSVFAYLCPQFFQAVPEFK
jgi:hypothetical protein